MRCGAYLRAYLRKCLRRQRYEITNETNEAAVARELDEAWQTVMGQ